MLDRVKDIFRIEIDKSTGRLIITSTVSNKRPELEGDSYNTVVLKKDELIELCGQLYELAESIIEYNPLTDPKYIYQNNLMKQVYIQIREEDGQLVKRIIRNVKDIKNNTDCKIQKNDSDSDE